MSNVIVNEYTIEIFLADKNGYQDAPAHEKTTWWAFCPDWNALGEGKSVDEAVSNLREIINDLIDDRLGDLEPLPVATRRFTGYGNIQCSTNELEQKNG